MALLALFCLVAGVLWGVFGPDLAPVELLVNNADLVLNLLMLLVGVSVGMHRGLLDRLRQYHIKVLIIPFGVVAGSILGGFAAGLLLSLPIWQGAAVASGLGWYSLGGVMLTELAGPTLGGMAFLSNLMRELLSFFSIPWISRHLNYPACIAPAGATSEDTTLSMMVRYTDEETVVLSVFNGALCSALVPVLIRLCWAVAG